MDEVTVEQVAQEAKIVDSLDLIVVEYTMLDVIYGLVQRIEALEARIK